MVVEGYVSKKYGFCKKLWFFANKSTERQTDRRTDERLDGKDRSQSQETCTYTFNLNHSDGTPLWFEGIVCVSVSGHWITA